MDGLLIRTARVAEVAALEALQWRASLAWDDQRDVLLANPDAIVLPPAHVAHGHVRLAERDGRVAGFSVLLPGTIGLAELDGLFVEPDAWRGGIGRALVRQAATDAVALGARGVSVVGNPRAEAFYRACGFVGMGVTQTRFGPGLAMVLSLV